MSFHVRPFCGHNVEGESRVFSSGTGDTGPPASWPSHPVSPTQSHSLPGDAAAVIRPQGLSFILSSICFSPASLRMQTCPRGAGATTRKAPGCGILLRLLLPCTAGVHSLAPQSSVYLEPGGLDRAGFSAQGDFFSVIKRSCSFSKIGAF